MHRLSSNVQYHKLGVANKFDDPFFITMMTGTGAASGSSSTMNPSFYARALLGISAAALLPTNVLSDRTLVHYTLDPVVQCGDGSPAGYYTDAYTTVSIANKHQVINFMGGGGCASTGACKAIRDQQPYMLSSKFEPKSIEGATILSNDANENPGMAGFTKWNVHYCSQDLWLGNGGTNENLVRSGSLHVRGVLDRWLNDVLRAGAEIDILVVAGTSAGKK